MTLKRRGEGIRGIDEKSKEKMTKNDEDMITTNKKQKIRKEGRAEEEPTRTRKMMQK